MTRSPARRRLKQAASPRRTRWLTPVALLPTILLFYVVLFLIRGDDMAGANTITFTDANFDAEVLQSHVPVLVDFWAEWCSPCKALTPTIDELANEYAGKVKVGKVDTDANQQISMKYGVSSIPTVMLFQGGQIKEKFVGLRSKRDFKIALDGMVAGAAAAK